MKIGFFTDLHADTKTPVNRKDDYCETMKKKFCKIMDIFDDCGCRVVVFGGDFFDSEKEPYKLTNWFIDFFHNKSWAKKDWFLSVAGQHDQVHHTSDLENTPYQSLVSSGCIKHLSHIPHVFPHENVAIYGCSWGERVPQIQNKEAFNILVVHDLIVQEKIWEGQTNVKFGIDFLKEHKFQCILAGDNHSPFVENHRGRFLIMGGSLLRRTIAQKKYKPSIYIIDTEEMDFETISVPIVKDVFITEENISKKATKKEMEQFKRLLEANSTQVTFLEKVQDKMSKVGGTVREEIHDIIKTVRGQNVRH